MRFGVATVIAERLPLTLTVGPTAHRSRDR